MPTGPETEYYFEKLAESRGDYLVEYLPWLPHTKISILNITTKEPTSNRLGEILQDELRYWLGRYPVPVLAYVYDFADEPIVNNPNLPSLPVAAWIDENKEIRTSGNLSDVDAVAKKFDNAEKLRKIYFDIPFKTTQSRKLEIEKKVRETIRLHKVIALVTLVRVAAIPVTWAIIQYLGPGWLARLVLFYVVAQALWALLKFTKVVAPSQGEQERIKIETKKAHYFYHCELNPAGFQKLKNENTQLSSRTTNEAIEAKLLTEPGKTKS